jgi:hypothetical protein
MINLIDNIRVNARVHREVRNVLRADGAPVAVEAAEFRLMRDCAQELGIITRSDFEHDVEYLRNTGDLGVRRYAWLKSAFVGVLAVMDGALLASIIRPIAAIDVPAQWLTPISIGVGTVSAGLLAIAMAASGQHLRRFQETRRLRRLLIRDGESIPQEDVAFSQPQSIDAGRKPAARRWARMARVFSLAPVWCSWSLVALVGTLITGLRYFEAKQLHAGAPDDVPSMAMWLIGILFLGTLFAALQASVFGVAYSNTLLGNESLRANPRLLDGTLGTEKQVALHNGNILSAMEQRHLKFHQLLAALNARHGDHPIVPQLYPRDVLRRLVEGGNIDSIPLSPLGLRESPAST